MPTLPELPLDTAGMLARGAAATLLSLALALKILARRRRMRKQPAKSRTYRTEDGRFHFRFSFEPRSTGYRVYIEKGPSYTQPTACGTPDGLTSAGPILSARSMTQRP